MNRLILAFLALVLLSNTAIGSSFPPPRRFIQYHELPLHDEQILLQGFPGWVHAHSQREMVGEVHEYIPDGQSITDWQEFLGITEYRALLPLTMEQLVATSRTAEQGCGRTEIDDHPVQHPAGHEAHVVEIVCHGPQAEMTPNVQVRPVSVWTTLYVATSVSTFKITRSWRGSEREWRQLQRRQPNLFDDFTQESLGIVVCNLLIENLICPTLGVTEAQSTEEAARGDAWIATFRVASTSSRTPNVYIREFDFLRTEWTRGEELEEVALELFRQILNGAAIEIVAIYDDNAPDTPERYMRDRWNVTNYMVRLERALTELRYRYTYRGNQTMPPLETSIVINDLR